MDKKVPQLIKVEPTQEGYRWVAITAMLLAIGIILHTVSPNVGGVTPNWTIAMYSIVINLTRPSLKQALGIGFIAGITLVPSSKSAFPLGNIASELFGATTCCLLVQAMFKAHLGEWKLRPFITGFCATFVSGGVFTFILKMVLPLPLNVWIYAMLPLVAVIGLLNGLITYLLFGPVRRLFYAQEVEVHEDEAKPFNAANVAEKVFGAGEQNADSGEAASGFGTGVAEQGSGTDLAEHNSGTGAAEQDFGSGAAKQNFGSGAAEQASKQAEPPKEAK